MAIYSENFNPCLGTKKVVFLSCSYSAPLNIYESLFFGTRLDVEMSDKSEAAMREGVHGSRVVIAIITDDGDPEKKENAYFERPFCLSELRWALDANIFIQPVVAADDKQRIGELLAKAPDDLRDLLGSTDFIHLDRNDKEYWDVGVGKIRRILGKQRI